MNLIEK